MSVPTYSIPSSGFIKQGDTLPSWNIEFSLPEYTGDFTTATIKMQVGNGCRNIIDISNGNGITVVDANNCTIDKIVTNDFPVGTFTGDFQVTEANGDRKTYFNVSYTVVKEYTEDA